MSISLSWRRQRRTWSRRERLGSAALAAIEPLETRMLLSAAPHHRSHSTNANHVAAVHQPAQSKVHPAKKKVHGGDGHGGEGNGSHGHGHGQHNGDSGDGNSNGGDGNGGNSGGTGGASSGSHTPPPVVMPPDPGPTAEISAADVTTAGGAAETITVTFTDNGAVSAATIKPTNITVTGPSGALTVMSASAAGGDAASVAATYTVAAPHGTWGHADDGSYTISLNANQVTDTNGNAAGGASSSFTVNIPAPPPPPPAPPDPTFAGGQTVSTAFTIEAILPESDGSVIAVGHEPGTAAGQMRGVIEHFNADGSVDTTFGSGGAVLSRSGTNEAYYAVVLQDAGHFVVAGSANGDFVVARYDLRGRVDSSFGTNGRVVTDFGAADDTARGLSIAPGGMIIAGGDSGGNFAFARYDSTGRLDANFAQGGRQLFGLGTGGNALGDIALQGDGRIVAVGSNGGTVIAARLTAAGEADATFGSGGVATVASLSARTGSGPDRSEGIAIQGQDILVANQTATGHFGVVRLTPTGAVDHTFGTNGLATADFGGSDDADSLVVQSTGQIIAIGTTLQNGVAKTAVAAFDPNGQLIPNFGTNGLLALTSGTTTTSRELHLGDIVLRAFGTVTSDGRIVIGTANVAVASTTSSTLRRLIVPGAQIASNASGTPIGTFGVVNGKRKSLTLTDADGTRITLTLAGGTATAYQSGDLLTLAVNDMGGGVSLSITGTGGDGRITLGDVMISGTLRSLVARTADLSGTLHVTGASGRLTLGNISGKIICADSLASLTAGDLSGSISATGVLGRLRLAKVSGTIASARGIIGAIFATSLTNAHILSGANLGADGALGGSGGNADTFGPGTIGAILVAGDITSSFIGAGVDPVDHTFGNSNDKAAAGATATNSAIHLLSAHAADGATRFEAAAFDRIHLGKPVIVAADSRFRVL